MTVPLYESSNCPLSGPCEGAIPTYHLLPLIFGKIKMTNKKKSVKITVIVLCALLS
jgi:hypothetical protein